jgi:hypothetical protein
MAHVGLAWCSHIQTMAQSALVRELPDLPSSTSLSID